MLLIALLCSLHSPIHVCINCSHAVERLLAADFRSKRAVKVTASKHSALRTSHLVMQGANSLDIVISIYNYNS